MSEFIKQGTEFPTFYQFPDFLLRLPISQTAKLTYMLLYDRARLSQKNNWTKYGSVYVNYTIKAMAQMLGKSESTVKSAYNELSEIGLLIRKDGGFSKPNELYVLIPSTGQFSELLEKVSADREGNNTTSGQDSVLTEGRFQATNKVIETNNRNQSKRVNPRIAYGRYKNILLTEEEYGELKSEYPYRLDALIEEMSCHLSATGKQYQNYEAALRSWAERDAKEQSKQKSASLYAGFPDYSFEEGESL